MSVPKQQMKQNGKAKASSSADEPTQGGGFLKALSGTYGSKPNLVRTQAPYFIWMSNVSNAGVAAEVHDWLGMSAETDFDGLATALKSLYINAKRIKKYLTELREQGKGDVAAAAITIICLHGEGVQGDVDVVVASSSLNQHSDHGSGQIHAEHISTDLAVDAVHDLDQLLKPWGVGKLVLKRCHVLIYTCDKGGSNFAPCISCKKTVTVSLKKLKARVDKIEGIHWEHAPKL